MDEEVPIALTFDVRDLTSRIERTLGSFRAGEEDAEGTLRRYHLESRELSMVVDHVSRLVEHQEGNGSKGTFATRPHVGTSLQDMVKDLEDMVRALSGLPWSFVLTIRSSARDILIRLSSDGLEIDSRYRREDAPGFAREMFRRRADKGDGPKVVCPYCGSMVVPKKGLLWGQWCPTCAVLLVPG